jgi:hypothetical protein
MKKILSCLIIAAILVPLLSGCGGRDLSTPSSRLVGHWAVKSEAAAATLTRAGTEYYFSKIGWGAEEGTVIEVSRDGTLLTRDYFLFEGQPANELDLIIEVTWRNVQGIPEIITFTIPEDGMSATMSVRDEPTAARQEFTIEYIDDKTEP